MTHWRALIECRNHWQWLAITGSRRKGSYQKAHEWPFECACCFYAFAVFDDREEFEDDDGINIIGRDCIECPLSGYAWGRGEDVPCCDAGSIFDNWFISKLDVGRAIKYAQQMVNACNRAIEDYILQDKGEMQ